jgi:serine/threonine-protein kinase LegK1
MDKLEGVELFHVLQRDINKEERLTVEQRIQLALALYKGLKAQVSDLRIIHRDLKPENIMVDLEKMEVRFFDYGFAITLPVGRKEIEVSNFCGTATYVSPETLVGSKISFATDLYSLTRVLILLWGGVDESFIKDNPEPISLIKERHKLRFLFKDLSKEQQTELSKSDIRNDIKVLLARGLDVDQYKRGTVEDAIGEFERIFEKYNQRLTRQPRKAIEVKPEFGRAAKACAALGGPTPDKTSMRPSSSDKRGDSMFTLLNGLFFNPPTAAPPSFKEAPSDEGSEEKCLYYG